MRPRRARGASDVVVIVAGTRPECIKLAPLVRALSGHRHLHAFLVNSGQHSASVRRTFNEFGLGCDVELAALPTGLPHLGAAHEHLRVEVRALLAGVRPSLVLVQGDTLSAYSAARAAADLGCVVGHVEAGLRTDSIAEPFPEEWFRRRISRYAGVHFAPTKLAVDNLLAEGIDPRDVYRVGNTGIDSLRDLMAKGDLHATTEPRRTVLVTMHRRENYDRHAGLVCDALIDLIDARPELHVVFPVHPNPHVATSVRRKLGTHPAFSLVEPMSYRDFVQCACGAALIISDSGGVQEEAPHLGTPLLVPRCNTERPECLATGFVELAAADRAILVRQALHSLDRPRAPPIPIDAAAPFGSGDAALRILRVIERAVARQEVA
jgi:UDP-N-acetylglucosamine 2-epimerase (non-hydrolysing)